MGTPRTDKALLGDLSVGLQPEIRHWGDAVEFARGLERELAAMTKERNGYRDAYDGMAESARVYRHRLIQKSNSSIGRCGDE
jgi:hypothetical protein